MDGNAAPLATRPRSSRRLVLAVTWGAVALAVAALVVSGQARAVLGVISSADRVDALALLGIGVVLPVVHARRWQMMLRAISEDVPLAAAVEMTVAATLFNYAVPGYVGSPAKGLMARRFHGVGIGRALPTLAAEQVLDAALLAVGSVAGALLVGRAGYGWLLDTSRSVAVSIAWVAVALAALGLLAALLLQRFARPVLATLVESGRALAADRERRAPILALSCAYWLLNVAAVWLAVRSVGVHLSPGPLLLVSNLPLLLGLVSPMPGGLGLREGAMVATAGAIGLPATAIIAAAVLQRGVLVAALPVTLVSARLIRRGEPWR